MTFQQPRRRIQSSAFTLVEFLVLAALVAILAALLISAAQAVAASAAKAKCAANLHTIGRAANLYAADNHGNLVPYRMAIPVGNPAGFWYDHLYEYVGRKRGTAGRGKEEYPAFLCPTAQNRYAINRLCGWKGHENPNDGEPQQYLKMGQGFVGTKVIQLPGGLLKTAWFACPREWGTISATHFLPEKYNDTQNFIGFPHSGSANVLFMDGHVEGLRDPHFADDPSVLKEEQWVSFFGKKP